MYDHVFCEVLSGLSRRGMHLLKINGLVRKEDRNGNKGKSPKFIFI